MESTHQGRTEASQVVCRVKADHRTLSRIALLCRGRWRVVGPPQDMVHTAVGPVVVSGRDLHHVCMEQ